MSIVLFVSGSISSEACFDREPKLTPAATATPTAVKLFVKSETSLFSTRTVFN